MPRPPLVLAGEEDVGGFSRWAEAAPILQEHNYQELQHAFNPDQWQISEGKEP